VQKFFFHLAKHKAKNFIVFDSVGFKLFRISQEHKMFTYSRQINSISERFNSMDLSNGLSVRHVKTIPLKISTTSRRNVGKKNRRSTQISQNRDDSQVETELIANIIFDCKTRQVQVHIDSTIKQKMLSWSVSYREKKVCQSTLQDGEWKSRKSIGFSINEVDRHVFYETFELLYKYQLDDEYGNCFTAHFEINVRFLHLLLVHSKNGFVIYFRFLSSTQRSSLCFCFSISFVRRLFIKNSLRMNSN
jgi:hypothetical protein